MKSSTGPLPGHEQSALDLRARRKLRTRRALQEAALQLFADQGYEETTVAQIAELAELGERTFFFHFPTKEDVLFNGSHDGFRDFDRLVTAAAPKLSDLSAIEFALTRMHEGHEGADNATSHRMTQLLVRAAESSAVVRGKRMEYANGIAVVAAKALGRRRQEDPSTLATVTVAEIAMRTFYLSVVEWTTAGPDDLISIFHRRFDAVRDVGRDSDRI